jgi:hypothetical protein
MGELSFSLKDVITIATILLGVAASYWRLDKRLARNEVKLNAVREDVHEIRDSVQIVSTRVNGHLEAHSKGDFK